MRGRGSWNCPVRIKGSVSSALRGRGSGTMVLVLRRCAQGSAARRWGHPLCGGLCGNGGHYPPGLPRCEGVEWSGISQLWRGPCEQQQHQPRWMFAVPHPSSAVLSTKACADRKGGACPLLHDASVRGVSSFLQLALQSVFQTRLDLSLSSSRAVRRVRQPQRNRSDLGALLWRHKLSRLWLLITENVLANFHVDKKLLPVKVLCTYRCISSVLPPHLKKS